MPGFILFRRRWSVGSDDLIVPAVFLLAAHSIWLIILAMLLSFSEFDRSIRCVSQLWQYCVGYLIILTLSVVMDLSISCMALRGGILDMDPRDHMRYIIYVRVAMLTVEILSLSLAVDWMVDNYETCPVTGVKKQIIVALVVGNWVLILGVILTGWCAFDPAGRTWVKMKKYQQSMLLQSAESRFQYKRSTNHARNWRQRKVLRAYQDSWDHRCRILFCCIRSSDRNKNSFADIARLLSDFFRDLDVVPSDVIAGLVLLRKFQKIEQEAVVRQRNNGTYEYLSGVPVTPQTRFLPLGDPQCYQHFQSVIYYMNYALAAYGWPMFLVTNNLSAICDLCTKLSCSCFPFCCQAPPEEEESTIIEDNCCKCNYAALRNMISSGEVSIFYATYHVDVNETPFFVAIDYVQKKIVISIRGTLSMKDVITDLNAESEPLPLTPPREDWLGHKGMVNAAVYIRDKLINEDILAQAMATSIQKSQEVFGLVLVGHSLGAGTAAILAILLHRSNPELQCFAYSPPGGLLSMPAVQYSKDFITSVVLGKDVVPRIGLRQLESLRSDLINAIRRSKDPKWKTIGCSILCCGEPRLPTSALELQANSVQMAEYRAEKNMARAMPIHPSDSSIALTIHQPLFPPGKIIHIVRHHPTRNEQVMHNPEPVYQALWANNTDFDEVLISPVMIQDHMPDNVLNALNKVINSNGPAKPQRTMHNSSLHRPMYVAGAGPSVESPPHKLCLETSFTSQSRPGCSKDTSINVPEYRGFVPTSRTSVDLIHDDWLGLAPLASPESLSEVSSISSRTSSVYHYQKRKAPFVTFDDCPVRHHFEREDSLESDPPAKNWRENLKQNLFNSDGFACVRSKTHSDSSTENNSIDENNDQFFSSESVANENLKTIKEAEILDSENTLESSPLLSSLHFLTDEKFQSLFKDQTNKHMDDSISSGSFKSVSSYINNISCTSVDSFTVNVEVHRTDDDLSDDKVSWPDDCDLLEDIDRSLKLRGCDSPFDRGISIPSCSISVQTPDINGVMLDVNGADGEVKNKYKYPILSIRPGESSV